MLVTPGVHLYAPRVIGSTFTVFMDIRLIIDATMLRLRNSFDFSINTKKRWIWFYIYPRKFFFFYYNKSAINVYSIVFIRRFVHEQIATFFYCSNVIVEDEQLFGWNKKKQPLVTLIIFFLYEIVKTSSRTCYYKLLMVIPRR